MGNCSHKFNLNNISIKNKNKTRDELDDTIDRFLTENRVFYNKGFRTYIASAVCEKCEGNIEIGFCQLDLKDSHIQNMGVIQSQQQKGVGSELVRYVAEDIKAEKLSVSSTNENNKKFYKSLGMKLVSENMLEIETSELVENQK